MRGQTLGAMIAALRKERGMTQLELAEQMGVTDKAVSKWERDLSVPDVNSIPKLAEIFGVSVDELFRANATAKESCQRNKTAGIIGIALKGIALAMGVAVVVLSLLGEVETDDAMRMLGLGLACLAGVQLLSDG